MELSQAVAIDEAVLFAAGDAVSLEKICEVLETDEQTAKSVITHIIDEYDYKRRGLKIIQLGDNYQMCTRSEYFDYIQRLAEPKRAATLSPAALEALAVVAYKQPITRVEIDAIRGVGSDYALQILLTSNLVEVVGRKEVLGRPLLYGTTDEFLKRFGLENVDKLPSYTELLEKIAVIRTEPEVVELFESNKI